MQWLADSLSLVIGGVWLMVLIGPVLEFMGLILMIVDFSFGKSYPILGSVGQSRGVLWETLILFVFQ